MVVVIKGEVVPRWFLEAVRRDSPEAVFIFYTFDSLANNKGIAEIVDLFDRRFSFEPGQSAGGFDLEYKPLFYGTDFFPQEADRPRDFDVSFIGTLHSDRYRFIQMIVAAFPRTFVHLYVQARWFFVIQRLRDRRLRALRSSDVRFDKLSREQVADVFRRSLAVLDVQHERQEGLTMRTFEVLASGAYLVTTNARVLDLLGDSGRVIVLRAEPTRDDVQGLVEMLSAAPALEGAPAGFARHSVDAWVSEFVELMRPGGAVP